MSWIHRQMLITVGALVCTLLVFEFTRLDFLVQDLFFDFDAGIWLWDKNERISRFVLYDGIKAVFVLGALLLAGYLLLFRNAKRTIRIRKGLSIVCISLFLVPALVNVAKDATNIPCPADLKHYGGDYPHVTLFSGYPEEFTEQPNVACFPAGHASGAFALLSLVFLCRTQQRQRIVLASVLALGWTLGLYKMVIGDHLLSHTLVAMQVSWLLILCVAHFFRPSFNVRKPVSSNPNEPSQH